MSVPSCRRKVAFSQFEDQAIYLSRYSMDRLNALPVRYHKFLRERVLVPASQAATRAILANEQNAKTARGMTTRQEYLALAVEDILTMQIPLLAVMNLRDIDEESCENWALECNKAIALIYGVGKWEDEQPRVLHLPKRKMQELHFLGTMSQLHKFTYQKIAHAPTEYALTICKPIAERMDTALYQVVKANDRPPETKQQAQERADRLQIAIDHLNTAQRPMLALWNMMDYSEATLSEWSDLLDTELKLLEGLKKADKARYKNLPENT